MGQLTQTTTELQAIVDNSDAANVGKTSLTDGSDTTAVAFKKSGFYSLQGSSSNAPSTDRAVLISAIRDTAATGEIRYGQIAITESNGLWWNRDDGGSLGTWYAAVSTTGTQTLTNKTLTSPVLTTPQINDSAADHQYIFAGSNLVADRTVTLPLLASDDTFVFEAHTQTLTNKTLTSPVFNTGVSGTAVLNADDFTGASATTLATSESIKAYVDTKFASGNELSEVLSAGNTTGSTDIEVTDAQKVQFRDAAIYINSSVDGQLDIVADTEIQIAATTIDINGAINASGEIIAASLDISGDIDVDGTANLDVVDIDGAVDFASTTAHAGNATFADNAKAIFGAGSDLQIFSNGTSSYIIEGGSGNLEIRATDIFLKSADNTKALATFDADGAASISHNGSTKLATSASGIDVTGTVTANDLTLGDASPTINFNDSDLANLNHYITSASNANLYYAADSAAVASGKHVFTTQNVERLDISSSGINVTGSVTADGLTVDGSITLDNATEQNIKFTNTNINPVISSNRALIIDVDTDDNQTGSSVLLTANNQSKNIAAFNETGDVSFYEDTGTTPKLVWKSADERLGIGDSSPDGILDVEGSITIAGSQAGVIFNPSVTPTNNNVGSVGLVSGTLNAPASTNVSSKISGLRVAPTTSGSFNGAGEIAGIKVETFNGQSATLATGLYVDAPTGGDVNYAAILNGGNVGIGTTPDQPLHVYKSSGTVRALVETGGSTDGSQAGFQIKTPNRNWQILAKGSDNALQIYDGTAAAERLRVDPNGNLLVGTTDDAPGAGDTNTGISFRAGGDAFFSKASSYGARFNRNTNDGDVVTFAKDGATVGSIGTNSGLFIGSTYGNDAGIRFASDIIAPSTTTGANRDAAIDLGYDNSRFKDLYLSGGVVFGATGGSVSSKTLDDYEEGTWTPALGGTWTTNPTNLSGTYTKVGNVVTIRMKMTGGVKSSAISGYITGLPFATNNTYGSVGSVSNTGVEDFGNCLFQNTDRIWFTETNLATAGVWISGVYQTTA